MKNCPYCGKLGHCKAISPWKDESAGSYPICHSSNGLECPHFLALCREAEQAAANVFAEQAAKRYLELIK